MINGWCGVRVVGSTDLVYSVENQHLSYVCGSPRYFIFGRATAIIYVPMQVRRSLRCAPTLRPQDFPASEGPRLYPLNLCSLLTFECIMPKASILVIDKQVCSLARINCCGAISHTVTSQSQEPNCLAEIRQSSPSIQDRGP